MLLCILIFALKCIWRGITKNSDASIMIQVRRKSTESDLFFVQNALAADSDYRMKIAKLHKIRICVG